jgi:hypothetical protein
MEQLVYAIIIFALITLLGLGIAYVTGIDAKTILMVVYGVIVFLGCIQVAEDL